MSTVGYGSINKEDLKRLAEGRWVEILVHFGFDRNVLDGRHHKCPKGHGTDCARLVSEKDGAFLCNQCFKSKNGDGIAALSWLNGWTFSETMRQVAGYLGMSSEPVIQVDIVTRMARIKKAPLSSWKAFGAYEDHRDGGLVCRIPMYDENRKRCSHQDYSEASPKLMKGYNAFNMPAGIFVAANEWPEAGDSVFVVEGCKDAAALRDWALRNNVLCKVIGLATCEMNKKYAVLFDQCDVVFIPDLDSGGEVGSNKSASRVRGKARTVRIARLPGEFRQKDGDGIREVLAKADGDEGLSAAIKEAKIWAPEQLENSLSGNTDIKPKIYCSHDEKATNDLIIAELAKDQTIFQRGGSLVRIIHESAVAPGIKRPATAPSIQQTPEASVREAISANVTLLDRRADEIVQIRVPHHVSKAIHSRGEWPGVSKLEAVVTYPVLRADGSVAKEPGYDSATGLYLHIPRNMLVMPESPTLAHAQLAIRLLSDLVSDFPFEKPAHRSAWLAYILTPLARFAFNGPTPLFMVDANTRGSGKTLISETGSQIVTGSDFARLAPCRDDDEMRKRITAIAMRGDPLILLDNVVGELGTPSLDAALTSTAWTDRILGQTSQVTIPLYATWVATGNNIILAADTTRRVCHIRLSSSEERPEERTGFQHADILAYVRSNRSTLLSAAMTILTAYYKAGRPAQAMKPWGSFEGWSNIVRAALIWAGEPDPGETRDELAAISDTGTSLLNDLITGWELADPDGSGMTASQAIKRMEDMYCPDELKDSIRGICGTMAGKFPTSVSLGKKMLSHRRRVVGGKCIDCKKNRDGVMVWMVVGAGDAGDAGHFSATP